MVTPWLILLPSSLALVSKGTFFLSCNGHGGGSWGGVGIVYLQPNCNRAMPILFANSGHTLHEGRRTRRLENSRAFAPRSLPIPL